MSLIRFIFQQHLLKPRHSSSAVVSCLHHSQAIAQSFRVVSQSKHLHFTSLLQPQSQQHSRFSTASSPSSEDAVSQGIQRLLCQETSPIGSLDSRGLEEMFSHVRELAAKESSESIFLAFQLLDRFATEAQVMECNNKSPNGRIQLGLGIAKPTAILHDVIKAWRSCWMREKSSTERIMIVSPPRVVLEKLSTWESPFPADKHTRMAYNMLISAAGNSQDPELAEEILNHLLQASQRRGSLRPCVISFNSVMDAWVKSDQEDAPLKVEAVLRKMMDLKDAGKSGTTPNVLSYSFTASVWANSNHPDAIRRIEKLMTEMQQRELVPDQMVFIHLLRACSKSRQADAAEIALAALQQMKSLYFEQGKSDIKPGGVCFVMVITALANHGDARRAEQLLLEQTELFQTTGDRDFLPHANCFRQVIDAWSKSGSPDAPQMAEDQLQRMQDLAILSREPALRPDVVVFNRLLNVWARSKHENAPIRCEQILQRMQYLYEGGIADCKPDLYSFNFVLNCWAKSSRTEAPERAEAILRYLVQQDDRGVTIVKPCRILYNSVIHAWSRAALPHSADRAQALFDEMLRKYNAGDVQLKPDAFTFGSLITAWARSMRHDSAHKAQSVFDDMIARYNSGDSDLKPEDVVFDSLIDAWAKAGNPRKAEQIIHEMESNASYQAKPTLVSYNAVMNAWAMSSHHLSATRAQAWFNKLTMKYKAGNPHLKPDSSSYGILISAWGRSQSHDSALSAQRVVDSMISTGVQPDLMHYNGLIHAWGRRGAGENAENILRLLESCSSPAIKPDIISYTSAINAWGRSDHPQAAQRAQALFDELTSKHNAGDRSLKPNNRTFRRLMAAWGRTTNGALQVAAIFNEMIARFKGGDVSLRPTDRDIDILIDAWARSGNPQKAEAILRSSELNSLVRRTQNDAHVHILVMDAWIRMSSTDGLQRAQSIYDEMIQRYQAGQKHMCPTVSVYDRLISSWCLQPDGITKAQALLDDMMALSKYREHAPLKQAVHKMSAKIKKAAQTGTRK